jgi:hypothetical protein
MEFIYYLLIALCLLMELSSRVNTHNIGKKVALALIIIGCSLLIAGKSNQLVELGIFGYLLIDVIVCFLTKRKP